MLIANTKPLVGDVVALGQTCLGVQVLSSAAPLVPRKESIGEIGLKYHHTPPPPPLPISPRPLLRRPLALKGLRVWGWLFGGLCAC